LKHYSQVDGSTISLTDLEQDLNNTLIILHNKLKHGVKLIKEFDRVPNIKCFADQMNQVWTNIIHNAVQAIRGKGSIILRLKHLPPEQVLVEIENDGPPIPKDILPRIFEPYFTTKPKGEGTGLGLSICRQIVS